MRASGKITPNFHSNPTRSLIMSGHQGREAGLKATWMGAVVLCLKTTSNSCREQAKLFERNKPLGCGMRAPLQKDSAYHVLQWFSVPSNSPVRYFYWPGERKGKRDFCITRSAVTVLPLPYAKAPSCSEAQNNNWTPCSLEDFACTLTTTAANRSVALGPLLFSLVLNGSTCLLHILAQMAVMLVWKGCFFLALSLLCRPCPLYVYKCLLCQ